MCTSPSCARDVDLVRLLYMQDGTVIFLHQIFVENAKKMLPVWRSPHPKFPGAERQGWSEFFGDYVGIKNLWGIRLRGMTGGLVASVVAIAVVVLWYLFRVLLRCPEQRPRGQHPQPPVSIPAVRALLYCGKSRVPGHQSTTQATKRN